MKNCLKSSIRKTTPYIAAVILCVALFILGLFLGASKIPFSDVIRWLAGREINSSASNILLHVRLPRSIASFTCGAALAVSGLLLQSALNNPLASAGIIGVNSGAGFFAVAASILFPNVFLVRSVFAFLGALTAALLVFWAAHKIGASRGAIIMIGIAVSSLFSAGTDTLVTLFPQSIMDRSAFFIGGFAHISIQPTLYALPFIAFGLMGAVLLASNLNVLLLGDEVAASLGLRVSLCRIAALLCAALLSAAAVCVGGLIGFVGLIVPHGARLITGHDHRCLVPLSALGGGALVLACDMIARTMFRPYELPVGILLSFLGAPFFIFLLIRRKKGVME